jgi:proteasome lid subunit RPN8/RPN11
MKGERYAMEHDLDFLGVYHSHPLHPAIPSEHDRVQAMPSFSYIILSTDPEEVVDVTSWQLNDDRQFDQEEYLILQTRTI